jgi:3-phosphoshikimate 1-carboxyvinyltransferase
MTHSVSLKGPGLLKGKFTPPGDKSVSHRAIMFGSLASGTSVYTHFLEAEDCLNTLKSFQSMGVSIDWEKGKKVTIHGVGMQGLKKPASELYLGNSGTSMRLMLGILAGQRFDCTLTGDPSLSSRPMKRVTVPLKQMGAQIKGKDNGNFAPLTIHGGKLKGIDFENKLSSAQVKSALLLAGLYADGTTRITEPVLSRDHTERFLEASGAKFRKENNGLILSIEKTDSLKPISGEIPGDISAAAFFIVGAALFPGSEVTIEKVCLNPTRTGLLAVLERMGADLDIEVTQEIPEPLGNIHVRGKRLRGVRIQHAEIPSLIDELPIIMIAMALAEGESLISGAEELRVKETDRIHSMVTNLKKIGASAEELPDGCIIKGVERFHGGEVQSYGDHRTAMSFAIATLAMNEELKIQDTECVATSFPNFFQEFERLKKKQ